jgi:hypothetical protein
MKTRLPFFQTHLSYTLYDGYAERGVAVQDGGADLKFSNLAIEIACLETLTQQLHVMHIRIGAASTPIADLFSPDGAAKIFRCALSLVPGVLARQPWD